MFMDTQLQLNSIGLEGCEFEEVGGNFHGQVQARNFSFFERNLI